MKFNVVVVLVLASVDHFYCWNLRNNEVNEISAIPAEQNRPQFTKLMSLIMSKANQICPDHTQCQSGTCCLVKKTPATYGCCPLPGATCCSDMTHCCPHGYVCGPVPGHCTPRMEVSQSKVDRTAFAADANLISDVNVICPDHKQCNGTCCKLKTGDYGCCPYVHGVCCSDQLHCCPEDTVCDVPDRMCKPKTEVMAEKLSFQELELRTVSDSNQICPDHSRCNGTCCKIASGYGCCPYLEGTCCSDEKTCCPHGYECDEATSSCRQRVETSNGLVISEVGLQELIIPEEHSNQICPDHHTPCNGTCCRVSTGYGCCPLVRAVCCSDQRHCCPEGSTCDVSTGSCRQREDNSGNLVITESGLQELIVEKAINQLCPDHRTPCNGTCCKVDTGYGCCPLIDAVCCPDKQHCCPHGSTCDEATASCRQREDVAGKLVITESGLQELILPKDSPKNVLCPDHETYCNGSCCWSGGQYACCPFYHGTCCADQRYCCPSGTTCDSQTSTCRKPEDGIYVAEMSVTKVKVSTVCPGEKYQCEGEQTCCWNKISSQWSCCTHEHGVCCGAGNYCCPEGSKCDLEHNRCTWPKLTGLTAPTFATSQALPFNLTSLKDGENDVVCPGGDVCPDGSTCCLQEGGDYGCCSFRNAVCCSDKVHCCPSGMVCNLKRERCERNGSGASWEQIAETLEEPAAPLLPSLEHKVPEGIVCPGAEVYCADGMTCCPYGEGQYACCPLPNAVCCQDLRHCCAEGMRCDPAHGTCIDKLNSTIPWVAKVPALHFTLRDNVCPDNSTCTEVETCCQNPDAETYYCCSYQDGVCCKTKAHCCMKDHRCTQKGKCRHKKHH